MAIEEHEVQTLFAEPLFRANIAHAITDDQVAFIKKLKMRPNKTNLISDNLYIFNEPELASIKDAIHEALDLYAKQVMGISQRLYVTQSWSLANGQNIGMHGHSHSNSVVSGSLYFTDLPQPKANMIFSRHRTYQQLQLDPEAGKSNIYNSTAITVTPKKGEVLLFSSSLQHYVEANASIQRRYSIAFNSFIEGKLGDYRDVSELSLKQD